MPSVRILHASDLHFNAGSPFSRHDPTLTERLARAAVEAVAEGALDAIALTGDLATTGSSRELGLARDFVSAPAGSEAYLTAEEAATLSAVRDRVVLLPGNHDRYQGLTGAPDGREFEAAFAGLWAPLSGSWPECRVQLWPGLVKQGHRLHFVSVDLSLTAGDAPPGMHLGWGRAHRDVLDLAVQQTLGLAHPASLVVWLVHFPTHAPWHLQLLDQRALLDALAAAGVRLTLFGHTHRASLFTTSASALATAGTATEWTLSSRVRSANLYELWWDAGAHGITLKAWELVLSEQQPRRRQLGTAPSYRLG